VEHLRGLITFVQRGAGDGARQLLSAARHLEPLNASLPREMYLEALGAAIWADDLDSPGVLRAAAEAARAAPPAPDPPRAVDLLLDGFALRLTEGYVAAAPTLTRALELGLALDVADGEVDRWRWLATGRASAIAALELWDVESSHALAARQVRFARDTGAPVYLQYALNALATTHLLAGELATAARLLEEDRLDRRGDWEPACSVCRNDARGLAGLGASGVGADRGHLAGGDRVGYGPAGQCGELCELGALQRPGSPRRGARRRLASVRT
jgi:hypothetical protein